MKRLVFFLFCAALLLAGCASAPRQELEATLAAVVQARGAGAPELAPTEYAAATAALTDAEKLIERRKYKLASEVLALSRAHARRAIIVSGEEAARRKDLTSRDQPKPKPRRTVATPRKPASPEPKPEPVADTPEPPPLPAQHAVSAGETLWLIAARQEVYGDPLLWPLLYRANRDQIRDPRLIDAGQILDIPRNISDNELIEALDRASSSEIFPVETLLQHRSTQP